MITGAETNTVYFSDQLERKYPSSFYLIRETLEEHGIPVKILNGTKDIWCRDYMPIQVSEDKFIQFQYNPSYLKDDPHLKSHPESVLNLNNLNARFSRINLDGGNVVNCKDKVIISKRVFQENTIEKNELISELEKLFEARVYYIPDINKEEDMTGHADGYLRFIDDNTVLVNELKNEYTKWKDGFQKMIRKSGLDFIEIPWFETKNKKSAIGIYVNYLEVGNTILFPVFEIKGNKDEQALDVIEKVFPERKIVPINVNEIGLEGELLNCVSWTVKE